MTLPIAGAAGDIPRPVRPAPGQSFCTDRTTRPRNPRGWAVADFRTSWSKFCSVRMTVLTEAISSKRTRRCSKTGRLQRAARRTDSIHRQQERQIGGGSSGDQAHNHGGNRQRLVHDADASGAMATGTGRGAALRGGPRRDRGPPVRRARGASRCRRGAPGAGAAPPARRRPPGHPAEAWAA